MPEFSHLFKDARTFEIIPTTDDRSSVVLRIKDTAGNTIWEVDRTRGATSVSEFNITSSVFGATGDGVTLDTTAFQNVLAAAHAAGGGKIRLPKGNYLITNPVTFTNLSNITLSGDGKGKTNIIYNTNDADGVVFAGCTNIRVEGISFKHKVAQTTRTVAQNLRFFQCTDVEVIHCEFKWSKSLGLTFEQTTNVRSEGNYVHDCLADGIHVNKPMGEIYLLNNRVESCGDDMVAVWNFTANPSTAGTYSVNITGNKIKTTTGAGVAHGIVVAGCEDFVIANNRIRDIRSGGISVIKTLVAGIETGGCRNGSISGNVVVNTNTDGAGYSPFAAIEVINLDAAGVTSYTITHENISITGNTIDAPLNQGIEVQATRGLSVTGNSITNPNRANIGLPYPIELLGVTSATVTGNTVSYTSGTTIWIGRLFNCVDVRFQGNHGTGLGVAVYTAALVDGSITRVFVESVGPGTPEGQVANPVGSIWHRTDGGAATSLYVKETGTSNTGWVAK